MLPMDFQFLPPSGLVSTVKSLVFISPAVFQVRLTAPFSHRALNRMKFTGVGINAVPVFITSSQLRLAIFIPGRLSAVDSILMVCGPADNGKLLVRVA